LLIKKVWVLQRTAVTANPRDSVLSVQTVSTFSQATFSFVREAHAGNNVGRGSDDTLFALTSGKVKFERLGKDRKQVSVYAD
jgi:hypothetical protein